MLPSTTVGEEARSRRRLQPVGGCAPGRPLFSEPVRDVGIEAEPIASCDDVGSHPLRELGLSDRVRRHVQVVGNPAAEEEAAVDPVDRWEKLAKAAAQCQRMGADVADANPLDVDLRIPGAPGRGLNDPYGVSSSAVPAGA
jgi:hypothetical protein